MSKNATLDAILTMGRPSLRKFDEAQLDECSRSEIGTKTKRAPSLQGSQWGVKAMIPCSNPSGGDSYALRPFDLHVRLIS